MQRNGAQGSVRVIVAALFVATLFAALPVAAAPGVPRILNVQGRLLDSGGSALGGAGTQYCFRFSFYDVATTGSGSKLWPSGSPSTMTVNVRNGIYNAGIGDTNAGGDTLDFNFQDTDTAYLNVEVATKVGATCAPGDGAESFETLSPRQRVLSAGYAINAGMLGGFMAAQHASGEQIPVLSSGNLVLGGVNPIMSATTTNTLTLQGFSSGDLQFFSSANRITASGNATFAGAVNASGVSTTNATATNLTVNGAFSFGSASGILKAVAGVVTTALLDLANDVSGILGIDNGGTGTSTAPTLGQVLVGNAAGGYDLVATSSLGIANASFSTTSASYFSSLGLAFSTTSNDYWKSANNFFSTTSAMAFVHSSSTVPKTYTSNVFTMGQSFAAGATTSSFAITNLANALLATDANGNVYATTSIASNLINTSGNWTGSFDGQEGSYYLANSFSTTSAAVFSNLGLAFSTTSNDHWMTQRNFFSTTSADAWKLANNFFSTTSAAYFSSLGLAFSTTSADYWETQQTARTADDLTNNSIEDLSDVAAMTENYGDLFAWNGSTWTSVATSTLAIALGDTTGTLGASRGGTGLSSISAAGILIGNYSGDGWQQLATSTLGLLTTHIAEGSNQYFTNQRVQDYLDTVGKGFFFSTTSASAFLAQNQGAAFSTTSADYHLSQANLSSFSTTSASYFSSLGLAFSTTSNNYWKSVNDFFSTTSALHFVHSSTTIPKTYTTNTFSAGQTFAAGATTTGFTITSLPNGLLATDANGNVYATTTIASNLVNTSGNWTGTLDGQEGSYYLANAFSTTSASVFSSLGLAFSTTSNDHWMTQRNFFSTTSADAWKLANNFFSTTSAAYFASVTDLFSTTSANYFVSSSSTIPKTYTNNSFTGNNTFTNATTTNLGISGVTNALLSTNANGSVVATTSINAGVIAGSLGTINGTTFNRGESIIVTAASSTLLSNSNTFTGTNSFSSLISTNATTTNLAITGITGGLLATDANGHVIATTTIGANLINTSGNWTGTFDGQEGSYYLANAFSTTSASVFSSLGLAFSTTSNDHWMTQRNFFSTTSADAWKLSRDFFSTTSSAYFASAGLAFSSTSASAFLAQNQGAAFSTTSADYHLSQANISAFSTTSATYFSSLGLAFSTTSAIHFIQASTTIPKTYTNNTFTGTNSFIGQTTWANASSTNISVSGTASTSNLVVSNGFTFGSATGVLKAAAGVVSASLLDLENDVTGILGIDNGGTGTSTAPAYGQVLLGNAAGGYDLVATSSLGITSGSGSVGAGTAGQLPFYASNGTTLTATSSLFLASNGKIGIGSTTPWGLLSISTNGLSGPAFAVSSPSGSLFAVSDDAIEIGDAGGTGDANFQFGSDDNGWSTGFYAGDKSFRIASSTNLATQVALSIEKGGKANFFGGVKISTILNCTQALETDADGNIVCGTDVSSGDEGTWASTTNSLAVHPADVSDVVLIGQSATSTTGTILEVGGNALFRRFVTAYETVTAPIFTATSTTATSTMPQLAATALSIGSSYVTSLTGSGLLLTNGVLSSAFGAAIDLASAEVSGILGIANGGTGTSTAPTYGQVLVGNAAGGYDLMATSSLGISSGSAFAYLFPNNATTSTLTFQNGIVAQASSTIMNLTSVNSTSTNLVISGLTNALLSTDATGRVIATTSIASNLINTSGNWSGIFDGQEGSYYLANSFSTTSATNFSALGLAFATTSNNYWKSVNDFFSTTSAMHFVHSSSTIPKSYLANTFTNTNIFTGALQLNGDTSATSLFASSFGSSAFGVGTTATTTIQGATTGTSTIQGFVNVLGTNSTSTFSGGLAATRLQLTATNATSSFASGVNLSGGCYAINGTCIGSVGGGVSTVSAGDTTLTVSPNSGAVVVSLNLANANIWTGLQRFGAASSTAFSALDYVAIGRTATTTIQGSTTGTSTIQGFVNVTGVNSTSTFAGGFSANRLQVTGLNATSSFAGGINLTGGCFAVNNTCLSDTVVKLSAIQRYTTNQAYTKPTGMSYIVVEVWGGGGAGADGDGTGDGTGGGGGGGYAMRDFTVQDLSGTTTPFVQVGAGGTVVASSNGNTGGTSAFAGFATSTGGVGGTRANGGEGIGGSGGTGSGGDVNLTGQPGTLGETTETAQQGSGGSSPRGGSGGKGGNQTTGNGENGGACGGGGGGAGGTAGTGGVGCVVIYEYTTVASGADLAENYPVADPSIGPGEIVMFDIGLPITVTRAKSDMKRPLAGIIATDPGIVLGETTELGQRPVALAGRVPTKVNLEGGRIEIGDRIALSTEAGVGKKARSGESSVGVAISAYDGTQEEATVIVFLDLQQVEQTGSMEVFLDIMQELGLDVASVPEGTDSMRLGLAHMLEAKRNIIASSTMSDLLHDYTIAGLEVITPRVVADTLVVGAIEPVENDVTMRLTDDGMFVIERVAQDSMSVGFGAATTSASTTVALSLDALGNAIFAGAITAANLTVGSADKPGGITMYDTDTGEPYCAKVVYGKLETFAGTCVELEPLFEATNPENEDIDEPADEPAEEPVVEPDVTETEPVEEPVVVEEPAEAPTTEEESEVAPVPVEEASSDPPAETASESTEPAPDASGETSTSAGADES